MRTFTKRMWRTDLMIMVVAAVTILWMADTTATSTWMRRPSLLQRHARRSMDPSQQQRRYQTFTLLPRGGDSSAPSDDIDVDVDDEDNDDRTADVDVDDSSSSSSTASEDTNVKKDSDEKIENLTKDNITVPEDNTVDRADDGDMDEEEEYEDEDEEEEDHAVVHDDAESDASPGLLPPTQTVSKYDIPYAPHSLSNMYISIAVMILGQRVDLLSPTCVRIARCAFISYALLQVAFLTYVRIQAQHVKDRTTIQLPNMNPVVSSLLQRTEGGGASAMMMKQLASSFLASSTTIFEYDLKQTRNMQNGLLFNLLFTWFLHFKMGQVQPLLINTLNGIVSMVYSPLFQIYILRLNLERPFVVPGRATSDNSIEGDDGEIDNDDETEIDDPNTDTDVATESDDDDEDDDIE